MPWQPQDAERHTKKAKSPKAKRQWSHVANEELGKGRSEASAIRMANSVVKRRRHMAAGGIAPSPLEQAISHGPFGGGMPRPGGGGMYVGRARMRMPRIPVADTLRNIDQSIIKGGSSLHRAGGRIRKKAAPSSKRP